MSAWLVGHEAVGRGTVFVVVLVVLAGAQGRRPCPGDGRWSARELVNLAMVALDTAFVRLVFPVLTVGFAVAVENRGIGLFNAVDWPPLAEIVLAMLVLDVVIYFQHRVLQSGADSLARASRASLGPRLRRVGGAVSRRRARRGGRVAAVLLRGELDEQRGAGAFKASIAGLRRLNALGYGRTGSGLVLNLIYNPNGAFLPPPQAALEADYERFLAERFGIVFDRLFTLANMPIKRFGSWLLSKGAFDAYLATLRSAHRPENTESVMCRDLVSVDPFGYVYDCDFNQMLKLPLGGGAEPRHLRDLLDAVLDGDAIAVADHCYGCTAGQGSSCGGALATDR